MKRLILPTGYAAPRKEARTAIRLSQHLRGEGWKITVYTPDIPSVDASLKQAGLDLRHLPFRGLTDYSTISHLAKHLEHEAQGAIILAQSFRTAFISLCARKLAGRPDMIVSLLDRSLNTPRHTWLARRVYRNLSSIIFTSEFGRQIFRNAEDHLGYLLAPTERLYVAHEAVGNPPVLLPEPKGPIIALYNGELREGSGLEMLIDILPTLRGKRIRLMIAGQGKSDYMDRLRRRAISRDVMNLISWRSVHPPLDEVAGTCHFGVFAYSRPWISDANVELMAAGRPQIITDSAVAREYFGENGGAEYVDTSNPEAVARAMLTLADNATLRQKYAAEAQLRYRNLVADSPYRLTKLLSQMSSINKGAT